MGIMGIMGGILHPLSDLTWMNKQFWTREWLARPGCGMTSLSEHLHSFRHLYTEDCARHREYRDKSDKSVKVSQTERV